MELKLYDHSDIQKKDVPVVFDDQEYKFAFICDVPGDNPDVLGDYDNPMLARRMDEQLKLGGGIHLDCETCCFYAYFLTMTSARAFIENLNAYIGEKAKLIHQAEAY